MYLSEERNTSLTEVRMVATAETAEALSLK